MRHQKKGRKFGREKNQRKALLKSLAVSLISKGKMKTTLARAKELRGVIERLITYVKRHSTTAKSADYHEVNKLLPRGAAKKLINEIAPKYLERPGGYTRIIKLSPRQGDAAKVAIIEFVQ